MNVVPNVKIRSMDKPVIDKVFGMEGGYVLDFTNRTFAAFFEKNLVSISTTLDGKQREIVRQSAYTTSYDRQTVKPDFRR